MKTVDGVRSRRLFRAHDEWIDALDKLAQREPAEALRIVQEVREELGTIEGQIVEIQRAAAAN